MPEWYLTEFEARQFYEAIGLADLADEGIGRLTGPAAAEYEWTSYLTRDNAGEGIEEMLDGLHYALFDTLRSRMLEDEGLREDDADRARAELVAGAQAIVGAIRHFQIARQALKP